MYSVLKIRIRVTIQIQHYFSTAGSDCRPGAAADQQRTRVLPPAGQDLPLPPLPGGGGDLR